MLDTHCYCLDGQVEFVPYFIFIKSFVHNIFFKMSFEKILGKTMYLKRGNNDDAASMKLTLNRSILRHVPDDWATHVQIMDV